MELYGTLRSRKSSRILRNYRVVQKNAQSLMHHNFAIFGKEVTRFTSNIQKLSSNTKMDII